MKYGIVAITNYLTERYITWRPPEIFHQELEINNKPCMVIVSYQKRLPTTICKNTRTVEDHPKIKVNKIITINRFSNQQISQSRNHQDINNTEQTLSLEFFHHPRSDQGLLHPRLYETGSILQVQHFKMEGVSALSDIIEEKGLICKIYLKDAYIVVPIHQQSQKQLTFQNQGIVYQYTSLAFGLSVFLKLMRYAIEPLRAQGIRMVYYLDNICILAKTQQEI